MKYVMLAAVISGALLAAAQQGPRTIRERQIHQQKRIGEGIESGQLTPREAVNLEKKESRLNREIRRDRKDGGGLSVAERRKINRRQNRLSNDIYKQKHDGQTVAPKK